MLKEVTKVPATVSSFTACRDEVQVAQQHLDAKIVPVEPSANDVSMDLFHLVVLVNAAPCTLR